MRPFFHLFGLERYLKCSQIKVDIIISTLDKVELCFYRLCPHLSKRVSQSCYEYPV